MSDKLLELVALVKYLRAAQNPREVPHSRSITRRQNTQREAAESAVDRWLFEWDQHEAVRGECSAPPAEEAEREEG